MSHEAMIDLHDVMAIGLAQSRASLDDGETHGCTEPPRREHRSRSDHWIGDPAEAPQ